MMRHEVKCHGPMFGAILAGDKTAEYRLNDRSYRKGDVLVLREHHPGGWLTEGVYTGRTIEAVITHITMGPAYGIPVGYAVLSIRMQGE